MRERDEFWARTWYWLLVVDAFLVTWGLDWLATGGRAALLALWAWGAGW